MTEGAQWAGQPIKLETEFIIKRAHGAVAGARRRQAGRRRARPGLSDRPRATIPPSTRRGRGILRSRRRRSTSSRASTHGLAPYDGKIEINVLALKPGGAAQEARHRCRRADRVPPSAAGDEGGRSAVHVGPDGVRRQRACARGRRRPAPAAVLVVGGGAGRIHHRQHRQALRSRRHVARPMSCASCSSTPTSASSIRSTRSGSAGSAAGRCRSPRSRCLRRCRCRARPC